jgi:hypothetical protein
MGEEKNRSLWIDRETFKPLFVRGSCPSEIGGQCNIEILNANTGKIFLVRKEEQAVVQFRFEKSDAQKPSDFSGNSSDFRDSFQTFFLE